MGIRSEEIEYKATALLAAAGALRAPVDLTKVASHLGAEVRQETFEDMVSGVLLIKDEQRHVMVNRTHHPNRQRFSVAHELGHLVLHHNEGDRLFIDTHLRMYQRVGKPSSSFYQQPGSSTTPHEERQANQFASALLMPRELLIQATKDRDLWDELDVSALASEFGVSEQAMAIRLRDLEVLDSALLTDSVRAPL